MSEMPRYQNKLTDQQKRFCDEYMVDLNGKQAAIRAGYKPKSAESQASRLLRNAKVRAHIDKLIAEASTRTGINADRVLREYARIAFLNPVRAVDFDSVEISKGAVDDDLAAIASVKVKKIKGEVEIEEREIRFHDKNKALEALGKHLGMFTNKIEVTGEIKTSDKLDEILEQLKVERSTDGGDANEAL